MEIKERSRIFMFLLYNDNPEHILILDYIKNNWDYACIFHDKDSFDDGSLKKAHYHVVVRFKNPRYSSAIISKLNLNATDNERFLITPDNYLGALAYLIHYNHSNKYQYDVDLVVGPLKSDLIKFLNSSDDGKLSEDVAISTIIDFIVNSPTYISMTSLSSWCASEGLFSYFRRAQVIFSQILKEHNNSVYMSREPVKPFEHYNNSAYEDFFNPDVCDFDEI